MMTRLSDPTLWILKALYRLVVVLVEEVEVKLALFGRQLHHERTPSPSLKTEKKTLKIDKSSSYFKVLSPKEYYKRLDKKFSYRDLINGIGDYQSVFPKYFNEYNIFLSCHYWDSRFPKLFEINEVDKSFFQSLGDITCDINGSIPTTSKSTTLKKPYYKYKNTYYR